MKNINTLILATECATGEITPPAVVEVDEQLELEVIEGANDIVGQADEIVERVASMEDAVADVCRIEDIVEVAEETVRQNEGMTGMSAEFATIAIEQLYVRLGVADAVRPSVEAFGATTSRVDATKSVLANWKENIRKVWEAIKKAMNNVWKKLQEFYRGFFNNTAKVTAYAIAMKAAVEKKIGLPIKSKEVTTTATTVFNNSGVVDTVKIIGNHATLTESSLKIMDVVGHIATDLNNNVKSSDLSNATLTGYASHAHSLTTTVTAGIHHFSMDETTVFGPFAHGQMYSLAVKPEEYVLNFDPTSATGKAPDKAPTLTQDEATKLCDSVIFLMKSTDTFKKAFDKVAVSHKDLMSSVDKIISKASSFSESVDAPREVKEKLDHLRRATVSLNSFNTKFMTIVPTGNMQVAKAALNYVGASIEQYTAKAA